MHIFTVQFWDTSLRNIYYTSEHSTNPYSISHTRKSFTYTGPEHIEITPHLIEWLNNKFLPYFNTNPILWAVSVTTCPKELQPYLVLPDDQLNYKGTPNGQLTN